MRICRYCKISKSQNEFYAAKGARDGLSRRCKACTAAYQKRYYAKVRDERKEKWHTKYYSDIERSRAFNRTARAVYVAANRDKINRRRRESYAANIEQQRRYNREKRRKYTTEGRVVKLTAEYYRQYREKNRERVRANQRAYINRHPDRVRMTMNNNKSKRRRAPGDVTVQQWQEILLFYDRACGQCRTPDSEVPLTVDHFKPISKGGENTWRNVWPLCLACNLEKRNRMPAEPWPPHVISLEETGT